MLSSKGETANLLRYPMGGMTASGDRVSAQQGEEIAVVLLPDDGSTVTSQTETAAQILLAPSTPAPVPGCIVRFPLDSVNAGDWVIRTVRNWAPQGQLIFSDTVAVR